MRVYANCYELMSEIFREVWEMGQICHPFSMQNKIVVDDPDYETKEITNYSYCLTNLFKIDYLFFADPTSMIWAEEEFKERVTPIRINPGKAWFIRDYVWKQFLNEQGKFDYTYNERMRSQLHFIIDELIDHPDTRQAIISIWDPLIDTKRLGGSKRIPCSLNYQLLYRNGRLHIIYNQRSADVVTHFGNDVFLAWKLMEYIAEKTQYKKGYLFHNIGSLHTYKKDWPKLKQCIDDIKI
jgi:thymidylate synthase